MKKQVWKKWLSAVAVVAMGALGAVACDSSDDSGKQYAFEKIAFTFDYEVNEDVLALADVMFGYETVSEDGAVVSVVDTLKEKRWVKQFDSKTLPANFAVQVTVKPKAEVTYDKTSYTLQMTLTEAFKEYRTDGKVYWVEDPEVERHTVTLPCDPADPTAFEAALAAELALWNRSYAYVVQVDPEGGYDVDDND